MNSIEFGKKCEPYNHEYKNIFGYVPCRDDYTCTQEAYFEALLTAIEHKCEISKYLIRKNKDFENKRSELLRLIEVGASCFLHYSIDY